MKHRKGELRISVSAAEASAVHLYDGSKLRVLVAIYEFTLERHQPGERASSRRTCQRSCVYWIPHANGSRTQIGVPVERSTSAANAQKPAAQPCEQAPPSDDCCRYHW
jgi:hypothetical protein